MAAEFQALLFGDETGDFQGPLQKLYERQHGILFSRFIDGLNVVLHQEASRQRRHVNRQIPPFRDIFDLVKHYQNSTSKTQILKTPLSCIFQLGSVIRYAVCILPNNAEQQVLRRVAFSTTIHLSLSHLPVLSLLAFVQGRWLQ